MSATVAIPRAVVAWARTHYQRTGQPYLFDARPGDRRIDVLPGSNERYLLTLDPDVAEEIGLLHLVEGDTSEDRAAHLLLLLADAIVTALGGEPICFTCQRRQVGRVEVIENPFGGHAIRVRGHVALSCLSWTLHSGRAGYSLHLPGP